MRKLLALAVTAIFGLTLGACQGDSSLTSPQVSADATSPQVSADAQKNATLTMTKDLKVDRGQFEPLPTDPETGEPFLPTDDEGNILTEGTVTLTRHLRSGTISWKLSASHMPLETAYTVWVLGEDGLGRGGGGLVGPSGDVTASGNHCLDEFPVDPEKPAPNDCDLVDAEDTIIFFLVSHEPWAPGDVAEFRTPTGGDGGFYGELFATFPAPSTN